MSYYCSKYLRLSEIFDNISSSAISLANSNDRIISNDNLDEILMLLKECTYTISPEKSDTKQNYLFSPTDSEFLYSDIPAASKLLPLKSDADEDPHVSNISAKNNATPVEKKKSISTILLENIINRDKNAPSNGTPSTPPLSSTSSEKPKIQPFGLVDLTKTTNFTTSDKKQVATETRSFNSNSDDLEKKITILPEYDFGPIPMPHDSAKFFPAQSLPVYLF